MGRAYRTGIVPGFLFSIVLSLGVYLSVESLSAGELPWVIAAIFIGGTLWVGPGFSELYARVYVRHYPDRSFPTFAGTLTFWVAIVFSMLAIVLEVPNAYVIVAINVLATLFLGYLIPLAYDRGWAGGSDKTEDGSMD
ncbi:MAG: hypothetical protein KKA32_01055 [Actinobacteria bacterium]|nr:hypothetical protein [Actinomycetota bacterium]